MKNFLVLILAVFFAVGCSSDVVKDSTSTETTQAKKLTGEKAELIKNVVRSYVLGKKCEACKGDCHVVGSWHPKGCSNSGVGAYHVVCDSTGNEYECVYNSDNTIVVYEGGVYIP